MSKYAKHLLITILLVIVATTIFFTKDLVRGLDIAGGMRVVMEVDPKRESDWPSESADRREKMKGIRDTIENRVKGFSGVTDARVIIQGENRLVVELPGRFDRDAALELIKDTAQLKFFHLTEVRSRNNPLAPWKISPTQAEDGSDAYVFEGPGVTLNSGEPADQQRILDEVVGERTEPILTGEHLLPNAKASYNQRQQPVILVEFNRDGAGIFRDFTRKNVNEYLAIFLDTKLLTSPTINEPITDGSAEISGFNSLKEARETAERLNSGALPVPLKVLTSDQVEPSLGQETIDKVVYAGLAGLFLVVIFMIAYYRLPGVIASIALVLYALFVLAAFKLFGATMSLAGVAALIMSIGMAVDANILIFERLKEELRSGKTLRASIDAGFARAFAAIFDSNMCTAITCAILLWYGSPSVQSFALTLLVGVAISMFTAIVVTRTILHMLVGWEWAQNPHWFGLNISWLSNASWNIVGKRNIFFVISAVLIVPGLIMMGLNYGSMGTILKEGIEFQAGTSMQATFKQPVRQSDLRAVVVQATEKRTEIQMSQQGKVAFIKTDPIDPAKQAELRSALNDRFGIETVDDNGRPQFDSVSSVEPTFSAELKTNAFLSILFASAVIILYLTFRFATGGLAAGFKFGVCAVIALIHDALFILGAFAILGRFYGWEVDSLFVTAVLTIIGYSVHDTIVVFDRIRENLRHRERGETFEMLANKSVVQTLSRSLNTSFTVMFTLGTLIAFGGPLMRHFYVAMMLGVIVGTYSSIFNATSLIIVWEKWANRANAEPKKKAFEDKALVETPMSAIPGVADKVASNGADDSVDAGETSEEKSARIKRKTSKKRRF